MLTYTVYFNNDTSLHTPNTEKSLLLYLSINMKNLAHNKVAKYMGVAENSHGAKPSKKDGFT